MPVDVAFSEKTITGCVYGGARAGVDLVRNLRLYTQGRLKIDEMITRTYPPEEVNVAFDDMYQGRNVRGLINF
jgi:S-(hydroxymethyl)glutathione dehydrogenase/alcohol dehydrogenase